MKKIRNFLFMTLMALMMTLVSCENSSLKAINEKIEKEGPSAQFTSKEYAEMANYLLKNYSNMMDEYSSLDLEDKDFDKKIEKLEKKYPFIGEYMMILSVADYEGALDKGTSLKVKKLINEVKDIYKNNYGVDFTESYPNNGYDEDIEIMEDSDSENEEVRQISLGGLYEGDSMSLNLNLLSQPKRDRNGERYNIEGEGMYFTKGGRQGFDVIGNMYENGKLVLKEIDYGAPEYDIILDGKIKQIEGGYFFEGSRYVDGENLGYFKLSTDA